MIVTSNREVAVNLLLTEAEALNLRHFLNARKGPADLRFFEELRIEIDEALEEAR